MRKVFFKNVASAALLFAFGAGSAYSAVLRAQLLRGQVVDAVNAAVPGAEVIIAADSKVLSKLRTDSDGWFSFQSAPGPYDLTVHAVGFWTLQMKAAYLSDAQPVTLRVKPGDPYSGPVRVGQADELPTESPVVSTLLKTGQATGNMSGAESVHRGAWNYGVLTQGGVGLQDRSNYGFFMLGVHAGKVLTPQIGHGLLQGNGEYAVEVLPLWMSFTPTFLRIKCATPTSCSAPYTVGGTARGASITPILLKYNFTHGERLVPWVQGGGGVLWTNHKYPAIGNLNAADPTQTGFGADTSVWNFTPQGGIGVHYFTRSNRSVDVGLNAVHISSASLGDKNPGVNSSLQFSLGYSWWK